MPSFVFLRPQSKCIRSQDCQYVLKNISNCQQCDMPVGASTRLAMQSSMCIYIHLFVFRFFWPLQDPDSVVLTRDDWKKINQRFTQTVLPKNPATNKQWADISANAKPGTKTDLQHRVLQAWVLDPKLGKFFQTQITEIITSHIVKQEIRWISKKELLNDLDESEAEEMLESGALVHRKHPLNPKRLQFRRVLETETKALQCDQQLKVQGSEQFDGDRYQGKVSGLERALSDPKAAFKTLKSGKTNLSSIMGGAGGDSDDGDDDDDDSKRPSKKPKSVLNPKEDDGTSKPKKGAVKPEELQDVETAVCAGKSLLQLLDKQLTNAKTNMNVFKSSSYCNPKKFQMVSNLIRKTEKAVSSCFVICCVTKHKF